LQVILLTAGKRSRRFPAAPHRLCTPPDDKAVGRKAKRLIRGVVELNVLYPFLRRVCHHLRDQDMLTGIGVNGRNGVGLRVRLGIGARVGCRVFTWGRSALT